MVRSTRLNPVSIACIYAALAGSWILFSDTLLHRLGVTEEAFYRIAVFKGIAFVLFTSFTLYLLVRRMVLQMRSARLAHEAELRESEVRFSTAFNSSPEPMSISSMKDGRYLEVNEALQNMVGYTRAELIGRAPEELGIWIDPKQRWEFAQRLMRGEAVKGFTAMLRRKDGSLIQVELSGEKIVLHGNDYILGIGRDVTVQRRLERQFLEAQKMEALGQLAAGVAHDFRNLLMLIRGYTEMLDIHTPKNAEYRQHVLNAVEKADVLTRQLLAYSRRQEVRPEVLDLNSSVSDLAIMARQMFTKSIQVTTVLEPALWKVVGDRGQMEQVLMNLAVNSQHAMPNGGAFVVSTSNKGVEQGFPGLDGNTVPPGEYVEIAVRDTGCGIPPEIQKRIFEPFFTTKERGKGTGLGLAAVYGIVKQSNGYTLVESQEGSGTIFRILLPRYTQGRERAQA